MSPDLLNAFVVISGMSEPDIIARCTTIALPNRVIFDFYNYFSRFPTDYEADFIAEVGLYNYCSLCSRGVICA